MERAQHEEFAMQVKVLPGQRRPGVGRRPASENRRAFLPQQARFCPVLEDASKWGYLVYAPLLPEESLQVRNLQPGLLRLTLLRDVPGGGARPLWVMDIQSSGGGGGVDGYDVKYVEESLDLDAEGVRAFADALITNVNAPPGAVGIRGAHDFVTPEGWDTVYTGILNMVDRPTYPVLTARIETDWYPQPTEFRYALQPGDILSVNGASPIGQVFFVPREPVTLVDGTEADTRSFNERQEAYWTERHAKERSTNFGTTYSYHYRDLQKERRTGSANAAAAGPEDDREEE
jgi:hypothetical protein